MRPLIAAFIATALYAPMAQAQDPEAGGEHFYYYCASCHGDDATGGGPMTEILNATPPDLTGLAARNGGVFPRSHVVFRIDGRDPNLAHGGPMPIFGDIFGDDMVPLKSETGQPILAGRAIIDLIAWLELVQG